jgi:murein DD-endopeptidase MepM/ murein hydrolase activator NlpD
VPRLLRAVLLPLLGALVLAPEPAFTSRAGASAEPPAPTPAWFRPVIVHGRAYPLARANFLAYDEIESNWHAPRMRLIDGKWRLVGVHEGIDIAAERGTPIYSMTPGRVENVGWAFYSGTRVGVRGTDGRYYFYAHLSAVAPGIGVGTPVSAGTTLGLVGNTGYGAPGTRDQFPPHLHFGIQVGPLWVDPYSSLVSLYDATVRAERRAQASLDRLARRGDVAAWRHRAAALYVHPTFTPGE